MIRLSVLDQSPIRAGGTAAEAIAETLELARACERWGYHRYWLAEHHGTDGLAGSAPEILTARVAGLTREMRVGTGGVMLTHYSAYKVAETFRVLEALYPGRIDLGVGRAPGGDMRTARALAAGPGALGIEHFPNQLADLLAYLGEGPGADHPLAGLRARPVGAGMPEFWLLGSSDQSAVYAAYFGAAFSFAHFITDQGGEQVMAAYRAHFRPSPRLAAPRGSVAVFVLCADDEAEARRLGLSRDLWRLKLQRGELGPVPAVEDAGRHAYSPQEEAIVRRARQRQIVGAPEQVRARLETMSAAYGVDEFVIVTICFDFAARLRSYELLAQAFELAPRAPARLNATA